MAHVARKRFGQHFLHDTAVIRRILDALAPKPGDRIVEIGPGQGALTLPLLERVGGLHAVELDRDLIPALRAAAQGKGMLHLHVADALSFDFSTLAPPVGKLRLVGNLPYNISTPLLFHVLAQKHVITDMLFMLQKEVVDRMAAQAGDPAYGRLSVTVAAQAAVETLFGVGPGAFRPPPQVESAVVRITPRAPAYAIESAATFEQVVSAAFSQRRKTLANALRKQLSPAEIASLDIDPRLRPERITPAEYARIANLLAGRSG